MGPEVDTGLVQELDFSPRKVISPCDANGGLSNTIRGQKNGGAKIALREHIYGFRIEIAITVTESQNNDLRQIRPRS